MAVDTFYPGSRILTPVSETFGLPIDQINFIVCQLLALILGYIFRTHYGPHAVSAYTRHLFEVVVGCAMVFFIFGYQAIFVLAQTMSCYLLMQVLPNRWMPVTVTASAMFQLGVCHYWRQFFHYKSLTSFDLSIPYMMNTQRVTSLAWSLYDGRKDSSKLTANQRKLAISKMPSLLEIFSFTLNFHSVIVGPSFFYKDYVNFIEGRNLQNKLIQNGASNNNDVKPRESRCPSPNTRVAKNLALFVLYSAVTVITFPAFPVSYIETTEFLEATFLRQMGYLLIITGIFRYKYFAVWKLGDAVNNNAGYGFYYDESGDPRWDLAQTANLWEIEMCLSLKMLLDNWNITTGLWLRYLVFERVSSLRAASVFTLSSVWHGFYPGYYFTAANAAFFGFAAKLVRTHIRPWFITTSWKHRLYDAMTLVTTRLVIAYSCFSFIHLEFFKPLEVYKRFYFCFHVVGLLVIAILSTRPRPKRMTEKIS